MAAILTCDAEGCINRIEIPLAEDIKTGWPPPVPRLLRAHRAVKDAGWRRRKCADGKVRDLCPECAKDAH